MEYISTAEAAEKWDISLRNVQRLINDGRIYGAKKYGGSWLIPANTEKPADLRRKSNNGLLRAFYTLPRKCPLPTMTSLYSVPGSADEVAQSLAADPDAQLLFRVGLAYLRGDLKETAELTAKLPQNDDRQDVFIATVFMRCLLALYTGDSQTWLTAKRQLEKMICFTAEENAQRDFWLGDIVLGLYDTSALPEWFRGGDYSPLSRDSYPFARYTYLKYIIMQKSMAADALVCKPLIAECRADGALVAEIYCRLMIAMGYHETGNAPLAAEQLDCAIALALPDRLLAPFAEYRDNLGILLDERLNMADRDALKIVKTLSKQLREGWTVLNRDLRGVINTPDLSPQERYAARLAAQGLSNAEIAKRMNLTVYTVKRHISEVIGKTGAKDRKELAGYIAIKLPEK